MTIVDDFGAAADSALPTVRCALDPERVETEFKHGLPRLAGEHGRVKVKAIRVLRHKPGRRCVIEYSVRVRRPDAEPERLQLIGKIRAKRFGNESYRLLDEFWRAGFDQNSPDRIFVPEPVGVLPAFQMWLQRKVPGTESTGMLTMISPKGGLCSRIAEAAHKIHQAGVSASRSHTIVDELKILHKHLPLVARDRPDLQARVERVLVAADRLAERVPNVELKGIHRDFYPAQVVVDHERLCILDFDLYCLGDPALDAGNFIGHLTELAIRSAGDGAAYAEAEQAIEERFLEISGEPRRFAVHAYSLLTLVRHIYISTQFSDRLFATEQILTHCEERFSNQGII